jgi:ABC-2 type transport system ATP-binding protein
MRQTGVVPEEPDAPSQLLLPELLALCASFHQSWDGPAVEEQLRRMKIPNTTPFGSLSRGQKTATMLALAVGHKPSLLILDDPTLGLDAIARRLVVDELIEVLSSRGTSVVVATHDLGTFERFAEQVVVLGQHRVLVNESTESLKHRFRRIRGPKGSDFIPFDVARVFEHAWGSDAIVTNFSDERFEAWQALREGVEAVPVSLEEIFLAVAGEETES